MNDVHARQAGLKMLSQGPLTGEEIEELDQFLLDAEGIEESMDRSSLDGYLTAIVCGPAMVLPSEWLRWVWDMEKGEDAPVFTDQAQAQRLLGLLVRRMNDIAQTLERAPERYEPLLMENPNDGDPIPILDEWCTGFMKGVGLDSRGWLPVLAGKPDWMSTILLYGTEEGWLALEKKNLSLAEHKALTAWPARCAGYMHFGGNSAASNSRTAPCPMSYAGNRYGTRTR